MSCPHLYFPVSSFLVVVYTLQPRRRGLSRRAPTSLAPGASSSQLAFSKIQKAEFNKILINSHHINVVTNKQFQSTWGFETVGLLTAKAGLVITLTSPAKTASASAVESMQLALIEMTKLPPFFKK